MGGTRGCPETGTEQQKEFGFLFFFSPVTHLSLISLGVSLQILQILRQMFCSPRLSSPQQPPATRAEGRENTDSANSPANNPHLTSTGSLYWGCASPSRCAAAGDNRFGGRGHQSAHQPWFQPPSIGLSVLHTCHGVTGSALVLPAPGPNGSGPARGCSHGHALPGHPFPSCRPQHRQADVSLARALRRHVSICSYHL